MTTDTDALVERLRAIDHMSVEECFLDSHLFAKAADEITDLRAENAEYRALLREWMKWHSLCEADDDCTYINDNAWCRADELATLSRDALAGGAV